MYFNIDILLIKMRTYLFYYKKILSNIKIIEEQLFYRSSVGNSW